MSLLWEAYRHVLHKPFDWRDSEQEVTDKVNAMTNYEFLELLDAVFDQAVKEIGR